MNVNCIDKKTLGEYLRAMRKTHGFKNTEEFSKALAERARYFVSPHTIFRIEAGKQDPSLSYICAVSIALDGEIISFSMKNMIDASACEEWQQVSEDMRKVEYERLYGQSSNI